MTYKKTLDDAKRNNIISIDLEIATEVKFFLDNTEEDFEYYVKALDDEEFEQVCGLVNCAYLKADDVSINQITRTVFKLIHDSSIEDVDAMSTWDIIGEIDF